MNTRQDRRQRGSMMIEFVLVSSFLPGSTNHRNLYVRLRGHPVGRSSAAYSRRRAHVLARRRFLGTSQPDLLATRVWPKD